MPQQAPRRTTAALAVALGVALALSAAAGPLAAQQRPPARQAAATDPGAAKAAAGAQAIVVLVNDEPITAYEIEQRAKFMSLNANIGDKVKENFKKVAQSESTNQKLRAIYEEVLRNRGTKNEQQLRAEFEQKKQQFAMALQKQVLDSTRASVLPQFRKAAQEELIDERLMLQEAKRMGIELSDAEVKRIMKGLADRNKMTEEQFAQHIKGLGLDMRTMEDRTRAQFTWREVIRRRFSAQISISNRDIDRVISATASQSGQDAFELQVHKITLPMPASLGEKDRVRRYAEADALRRRANGCKSMAALAKEGDARFEDLKFIKPSSIAEPTRSLLLSANDGDVLPPTTGAGGIEIYAVCGRRALQTDEKVRAQAQEELAQREFDIVAKRHLRDLRQDAHIEFR